MKKKLRDGFKKLKENHVVVTVLVAVVSFAIGWGLVYLFRDQLIRAVL